jgi:very-short-patch-repair endonuclease
MFAKNTPRDQLDDLITRARYMRSHPTQTEAILWEQLRAKRLNGYKFRRQHIIPPFIVDFYCAAKKFIIEVDGSAHEHKQEYDQERERYLVNLGYFILRFTNDQILEEMDQVLSAISNYLQ